MLCLFPLQHHRSLKVHFRYSLFKQKIPSPRIGHILLMAKSNANKRERNKGTVVLTSRNQRWNYLYFQASPSSHSISYVRSSRPFVNMLISSAGLVGSRSFFCRPAWTVNGWSSKTPNKTCRRCHKNDGRSTGTNITNWMGRRWNLKIKVTPTLILLVYKCYIRLMAHPVSSCVLALSVWGGESVS